MTGVTLAVSAWLCASSAYERLSTPFSQQSIVGLAAGLALAILALCLLITGAQIATGSAKQVDEP